MSKLRIEITVGEHAGKVVEVRGIGFRDFPEDDKPDWNTKTEGVWSDELGMKFSKYNKNMPAHSSDYSKIDSGVVKYAEYIDLVVAFDRKGNEIFIGDTLYVAVKNEVRIAKVVKAADEPYHKGYGVFRRKLTVLDLETNKKLTINDPTTTIKA